MLMSLSRKGIGLISYWRFWVCLCIVMANTYCFVVDFRLSLSCNLCCQFFCFIHSWQPIWYYLTFIYTCDILLLRHIIECNTRHTFTHNIFEVNALFHNYSGDRAIIISQPINNLLFHTLLTRKNDTTLYQVRCCLWHNYFIINLRRLAQEKTHSEYHFTSVVKYLHNYK